MYRIVDHKRLYGLDLSSKLESTGFNVDILSLNDIEGNYFDNTVTSPHVDSDKYLFLCQK